jgi:hypothetical protein
MCDGCECKPKYHFKITIKILGFLFVPKSDFLHLHFKIAKIYRTKGVLKKIAPAVCKQGLAGGYRDFMSQKEKKINWNSI